MRFYTITYQLRFFIGLIIISMLMSCSSSKEIVQDCYSLGQFRKITSPSFQVYFMNVKAGEKSRIDAYIQIPYNALRFERSLGGFKASYTLSFVVRDENDEIIQTKEIDRILETKTYEESISFRNDFFLQSLLLESKKYRIETVSTDNLSKIKYRIVQSVEAIDFKDSSFSASSILLLDTVIVNNGTVSLHPILPSSISLLNNTLGIFQEVYNIEKGDSIRASFEYTRPKDFPKDSDKAFFYNTPPYRILQPSCLQLYDSIFYHHDTLVVGQQSRTIQLFQFFPLPSLGASVLSRNVVRIRNGVMQKVETKQDVFRRPQLYRLSLSIDEVLYTLRYILKNNEYDSLASVVGTERVKKINEFWEERGGLQRRTEFERKVHEANSLFTSCVDGSRTPMGIVYIVCGTPDYIECRGSYNENWFYNLGDRVMSIQFNSVSEKKSQYFEIAPFTVNENLWQYFVERWRRKK